MGRYFLDFTKLFVFVLILYVPISWMNTSHSVDDIHQGHIAKMREGLEQHSRVVKELLAADQILEACQTLQAMVRSGAVYIYTLKTADASCYHPEGMEMVPPDLAAGEIKSYVLRENAVTYVGGEFSGGKWAIAKETPVRKSVLDYIKEYPVIRWGFAKDILTVFYVVCVIVFSGVLIILKPLASRLREKTGSLPLWVRLLGKTFGRFQLHDLRIVKAVALTLKSTTEDLQKDLDLLETSLEKSILNEIRQNSMSIPYSFKGTVAKVDINGFSKLAGESSQDQGFALTETLEEWGCELLQRYGGLYDKTVGDEIVAVFRGEQSELLALSFMRDLMREFSSLTFSIDDEVRQFTLKGGLSTSQVNFRKRFSGYGFDGLAFVISTRLMEAISNKEKNILAISEDDYQRLAPLCLKPTSPHSFHFKNMNEVKGYEISQYYSLSEVSEELFRYFRSDRDIVSLLKMVTPGGDLLERSTRAIEALRLILVKRGSPEISREWSESVIRFANSPGLRAGDLVNFSSLIMLAKNLIPEPHWTLDCRNTLLSIPKSLNARVNASIAEILVEKGLSEVVTQLEDEFLSGASDGGYRTQGEIVLAEAHSKLSPAVIKTLIKMLRSSKPLEVSTGVYCSCMVILHYRKVSPGLLESISNFHSLRKELLRVKKSHKLSQRLNSLLVQVLDSSSDVLVDNLI